MNNKKIYSSYFIQETFVFVFGLFLYIPHLSLNKTIKYRNSLIKKIDIKQKNI